jgi:multidrug resistance efflux pump
MAEQEHNEGTASAPEAPKKSRVPMMIASAIVLILGGAVAAAGYIGVSSKRVVIDKSLIQAPLIALAPTQPGVLKQVMVKEGDTIPANTIVAQVGTELIKSTVGGLVVKTDTDIGSQVSVQTPVVTVIDPTALRVVGQLDENKGLADLKVGDRAVFTVDAFGGKKFTGVVDEVSPTSHAGDVVFSISDKRQTNSFDVKVSFDQTAYPELKNGMSARLWIYK